MDASTTPKCSTSNCDNTATHDSGGSLVCGSCLHGMMVLPEPRLMDETARAAARKLVTTWCTNEIPKGCALDRPGRAHLYDDKTFSVAVTKSGLLCIGRLSIKVETVEAVLASVLAGSAPALVWALQAALDDGECLRGVIARAIEASNNIADRDAEDAIQEMLQHLLEPEPEGHDDRIEWARMEGANAMLEIIQREGYGARGIADNRDALRKKVAELAVAATMPRNPEPEFEAALLQREVEQLRAQLASQREAASERVEKLTEAWRTEHDRLLAVLAERTQERDDVKREAAGSEAKAVRNIDRFRDAGERIQRLQTQLAATQTELRTALRVIDHVAPRPWEANLDDPHDEQDNGEFDDGEWVITDASECEIDRSSAGSRWADGVTNGSWAREYVADVNALGATVEPPSEECSG
jgi:hypothetical protein